MPTTTRRDWIAQLEVQNPETGEWVPLGEFAVLEGGAISADASEYHDWDGPVKLGGVRSRDDATVKRMFGRHANEIAARLDAWVGVARIKLSRTPTDGLGRTNGDALRYTGLLGGVKLPDIDKGSADAGEIELTLHLDAALA